jgi:hypothetical protein
MVYVSGVRFVTYRPKRLLAVVLFSALPSSKLDKCQKYETRFHANEHSYYDYLNPEGYCLCLIRVTTVRSVCLITLCQLQMLLQSNIRLLMMNSEGSRTKKTCRILRHYTNMWLHGLGENTKQFNQHSWL